MCGVGRREGERGGKGPPNEAPIKPHTYKVLLLRGYLKQTIRLLALFASLGHVEGDGGGATHL